MLISETLERVFYFKEEPKEQAQETMLADPNRYWNPEDVLNFYINTYPILVMAKVVGPEFNNDRAEYRFVSTIGTKG